MFGHKKINLLTAFCLIVLSSFLVSCASRGGTSQGSSAGEVRYTKVNIHAQQKDARLAIASYANYTDPGQGHIVIPVGTEIKIIRTSRSRFDFSYDDSGQIVRFEFHPQRMGMGVNEYIDKITSVTPYTVTGVSSLDMKGIKEGKALVGMTKKGVMTALGYPATHKTPSLESDTWVYWTNRFGTIAVDFDSSGRVEAVRD